jgi:hypothetical protein
MRLRSAGMLSHERTAEAAVLQTGTKQAEVGVTSSINRVELGEHSAAWEQPQLFSEEARAAFRSLRNT